MTSVKKSMICHKNVIVFGTDQQRADSLGCMGNSLAQTPNLDKLASQGVLYKNHYSTNPICMPSRASFITGCHLQAHRVLDNGIFLSKDQLTMPEVFRRAGYRTASFGKLHFQPTSDLFDTSKKNTSMESITRWNNGELDHWTGSYYGFEEVGLAVGHGEVGSGHYGRWRARNFPDLKIGPSHAQGDLNFPQYRCYKSNMPLEAHSSTWVADEAIKYLDKAGKGPFYLNVSFPDPHVPFTPPAPYHSMFDDIKFPPPHAVEGENKIKPKVYREAMLRGASQENSNPEHYPDFNGQAYQQVVAHTHGMISLIDDCIGRVLAKLDEKGLTRETIIVFTSDHGDFLGDHHFFAKAVTPCRSLLHIPLIIVDPDSKRGIGNSVCSNVDVMPTLLSMCNIEIPDTVQGVILPGLGENPKRNYAFEAGWSKNGPDYLHYTIYKQEYRISIFPYLGEGELYDLRKDPFEHVNLFNDPAYKNIRHELIEELLYAVGLAEPERPPNAAKW